MTSGMARAAIRMAVCALLLAAPAFARDPLGVFEGWGAFRDPRVCYAIAEPARRPREAAWRPFASVAWWPARRIRAQLHVRLRAEKLPGAPVILTIGNAQARLVAGNAEAWARDARMDAAIIAAMRSGSSMSIASRAKDGRAFVDVYRLRGAATAFDAAALACARSR